MCESVLAHYFDLIFEDGYYFPFKITPELMGKDIIEFIKGKGINDFCILRGKSDGTMQGLLYSTKLQKDLSVLNFSEEKISDIFVSNRLITTMYQRMCLHVVTLDHFELIDQIRSEFKTKRISLFNKEKSEKLNVILPNTAKVSINFETKWTINKIHKVIYEKMCELYKAENIPESRNFRLGIRYSMVFPDYKDVFEDVPEIMAAFNLQKRDPEKFYFSFVFVAFDNEFSRVTKSYANELDLSLPYYSPEVLQLYTSLSNVRYSVETERAAKISSNPLLARMRLSTTDPPLFTCTTTMIPMRAELRVGLAEESATGASVKVERTMSANEAIRILFKKIQNHQRIEIQRDPSEFALVLQGTDEVIAGTEPMENFVCVRDFLISGQPVMSVLLVEKSKLIESISSKELSQVSLEEPKLEEFNNKIFVDEKPEVSLNEMPCVAHVSCTSHFRINIFKIDNCPIYQRIGISVTIFDGVQDLCINSLDPVILVSGSKSILVNNEFEFPINICSLPRTARVSITLFNPDEKEKNGKKNIASVNYAIFDCNGWILSQQVTRRMWSNRGKDYLLTTCQPSDENSISVTFSTNEYRYPIFFTKMPPAQRIGKAPQLLSQSATERIEELKNYDPTLELTVDDKNLIWSNRSRFIKEEKMLPLVLQSIDYSNPIQVSEIPTILEKWKPIPSQEALLLLDVKFPDANIREYAVQRLDLLTDSELLLYMLQLVQALKYEVYEDSALVRFLIKRGLAEPKFLGHQLFWQMISETHISQIRERFSLFIVNFIYGIGIYREELITGYKFTQKLVELNEELCKLPYSEATIRFRERLKDVTIPPEFHLPMDPRLVVDYFIIDECKVMNSKKKPFLLTFHNAAPFARENVQTMFKVGDDLRQDQLTLQLMKVMEHIWRENKLELRMNNYGVLPTGLNQGFIEIVMNSVTEQKLQQDRGIWTGSFDETILLDFIKSNNPSENLLTSAKENFMYSSAGYAVATCILGVADRHPGNIMLQNDGHFFHIDFGHFLGNFKKKFGYTREDAPFHFLPACVYVLDGLGSDLYKRFEENCFIAYNILRKNSFLLLTLMVLMMGTGIPELQKKSDLVYMKNMLHNEVSDDIASELFREMIKYSTESTKTAVNNWIHNFVCK